MEISEVKVKLMRDRSDRLKAFCSVTIDREFVIRDLKIIEGTRGMFVAMPSRKITDKCTTCGAKNHLRAKFCNECGGRLNESRAGRDAEGRAKLHADIAHPINSSCRDRMQAKIVAAYEEELSRSSEPGYKPSYDEDFGEDEYLEHHGEHHGYAAEKSPPQEAEEPAEEDEEQAEQEAEEPAEEDEEQAEQAEPSGGEEEEPQGKESDEGDSFGAGIF